MNGDEVGKVTGNLRNRVRGRRAVGAEVHEMAEGQ